MNKRRRWENGKLIMRCGRYTIVWKRCTRGVSLDGVEFKSLPSGLHNLEEDLVFVPSPRSEIR